MPQDSLISGLLRRYGETYSSELGLDLSGNIPAHLFRWLCACLLVSAPISARLAMRATRALADKGWKQACADDPHLLNGLNVHAGQLTYAAAGAALNLDFIPAQDALKI